MQILLEVFAQSLADRQTDKQRRLHILRGGGNNNENGLMALYAGRPSWADGTRKIHLVAVER